MKKEKNKILFGFPSREWRSQTIKLFEAAGYKVDYDEGSYHLEVDDPEIKCLLARTEEVISYVERGILDAGITQSIRVLEQKAKIVEAARFNYGNNVWWNTKLVLAVPEDSKVKSVKDLEGKKILARVTEVTKEYLKKHKVKAKVEWSNRPTEPKIPTFGDAIVEFSNTGNALRANNLKVIDVLAETSPVLIVNQKSWQNKWKREKVEDLGLLLGGARVGLEMAGLFLHASNNMMEEVFKILPALKKPTVTHLRGENWFEVFTVCPKKEIRVLIPKLKEIGCTGIIEFPLTKVII
jgi:ATP phosphoribosyltransferase